MDTNHCKTRRLIGCLALATGLAAPAFAQTSSGPAARLKAPVLIPASERPVISRGAAPDFGAFDTLRPDGQPTHPPGWMLGGPQPMSTAEPMPVRPMMRPVQPVKKASFLDSAWSEMKELVVGKPNARPMLVSVPAPVQPPAAQPINPNMPGVYAGPPAYRWYGWGTTTPGTNPYAPTGQYPRGSSNWYAQTGATPGAFPVPVVNPFRPAAGVEPPAYVGNPPVNVETDYRPTHQVFTRPAEKAPLPVPVTVPTISFPPSTVRGASPADDREPGPLPIAQTPPPAPAPAVTMTYPAETPIPLIAISAPATPAPAPRTGLVETPAGGLVWQAAGTAPTPFSSINTPKPPAPAATKSADWSSVRPTGAAAPRIEEQRSQTPTLESVIRVACQSHATIAEVKQTGPTTLSIRVNAATKDAARAAFEALSTNPQLRPYKIDFEANVAAR